MKTLIKGGFLVTAEKTFFADILIGEENIIKIGQNLQAQDAKVVDATGKMILPGGVDPHVHLDLPMAGTVQRRPLSAGQPR
jgi:dihydropyrimidinase